MFDWFLPLFADQILGPLIGTIVTLIVGWIAALYTRITQKNMEARHREALQSALENGVRAAVQLLLDGKLTAAGTVPVDKKEAVLNEARAYVEKSVPDAVRHFQLSPQSLVDLLLSKLPLSIDKK